MYMMHQLPTLITDASPYVTVLREGAPNYVDGKPVKRNPLHFFAKGLLVPLSGQELLLVPEGDRKMEQYWLFQDPEQSVDDKGVQRRIPLHNEDKFKLEDETYIVQNRKNWGSYVQARAMRVDIGPDALIFPTIPKELQ